MVSFTLKAATKCSQDKIAGENYKYFGKLLFFILLEVSAVSCSKWAASRKYLFS